jgi:ABC-type glycerol-3-phosphate transport system substrate-binding protein
MQKSLPGLRRFTHLLCAVSALGLGSGALAQNAKPLAGTQINVVLRSLPETDYITPQIPKFEEDTGIKVQVINFPENQLRDKLVQDLSTGAGQYQVIALDSMAVPEFVEANWIVPFKGVDKEAEQKYDLQDIDPAARGLLSYKDKLYALPIYAEISHMMYRKDLFEQAGVKPPTTFDEFAAVAKQFTDKAAGKYGVAMRGLRGFGMNMSTFVTFFRGFGGQFLDETNHPIFNNDAGVKSLQFYSDLLRNYGPPGEANFSWDDVQNAFTSGKVAMIIDADNFYTRIEDPKKSTIVGKIGYANVPAGPHGAFCNSYALGFAVSAVGAKSDKQKQAAAQFILWATSYDMQLGSVDVGIVSQTRDKVLNSDKYKEKANPQWLKSVAESWKLANPNYFPKTVAWRSMGDIVSVAVQEAIAGTKSPKAALDQAATEVTEYLKQTRLLGTPRSYPEP